MRKFVAFALLLSVSCSVALTDQEAGIQACEIITKEGLKSPASYQRIKGVVEPYTPGKRHRSVWLTYDAANAFGTMIRGQARCDLRPSDDGQFHEVDSIVNAAKNEKDAQLLGI